jgi:outer membrane murein-binding lipoprotein Lpp
MELSTTIATMAVVLGAILLAGHAYGQEIVPAPMPKQTLQEKVTEREAQRKEAMKQHQERKEDFARRCIRPAMTEPELESCRAAYRRL